MNIGELSDLDIHLLTLAMETLLETPQDDASQAYRIDLAVRIGQMFGKMTDNGVERVTLQAEEPKEN